VSEDRIRIGEAIATPAHWIEYEDPAWSLERVDGRKLGIVVWCKAMDPPAYTFLPDAGVYFGTLFLAALAKFLAARNKERKA
jgi:hypothetical protein